MKFCFRAFAVLSVFALSASVTAADAKSVNPKIVKIVNEISEERIKATIEKLVSFGTRNTLSKADDPEHGIGAAREWVFKELQSYSPKLQVRFDKYRVKKQGQRIFCDIVTTLVFLRHGVAEANPLVRLALGLSAHPALPLLAVKAAGCAVAYAAWRGRRLRLLRGINWLFAACVVWNLAALAQVGPGLRP